MNNGNNSNDISNVCVLLMIIMNENMKVMCVK